MIQSAIRDGDYFRVISTNTTNPFIWDASFDQNLLNSFFDRLSNDTVIYVEGFTPPLEPLDNITTDDVTTLSIRLQIYPRALKGSGNGFTETLATITKAQLVQTTGGTQFTQATLDDNAITGTTDNPQMLTGTGTNHVLIGAVAANPGMRVNKPTRDLLIEDFPLFLLSQAIYTGKVKKIA